MTEYSVTCVVRRYSANSDEGITHLGGATWRHTCQEVITLIQRGDTYRMRRNGHAIDIAIFQGPNGDYPRGHADRVWNDNLLLVPTC